MADDLLNIARQLSILQGRLPHIGKDQAAVIQAKEGGRTYGYKYADLATVSKAILPMLADLGLAFSCAPTVREDGKFVLGYALMLSGSDERLTGDYPLPTGTPQQVGSAITYARRYCLCAVTGAVADEDDDGAEAERADGLPVNADGSLSRSRTTDAQKNAAGVMTSAQHAEHTQLAKPPVNSRAVTRLADFDEDDPWLNGTPQSESEMSPPVASASGGGTRQQRAGAGTRPAPVAPGIPAEDRAGTASAEQIKTIQTLYSEQFKIADRDQRVETTRKFLGLDMLASHTQLSYRQAGDLLLAMRHKLSEKASK